jgi:hypothetical protein
VLDRVDEQLEVALPDEALREQLLRLYYSRYISDAAAQAASGLTLRQRLARRLRALLSGSRASADDIDTNSFDAVLSVWLAKHLAPCNLHAAAATLCIN